MKIQSSFVFLFFTLNNLLTEIWQSLHYSTNNNIVLIIDYHTGKQNNALEYGIVHHGIMKYCRKRHNSPKTPKTDKSDTPGKNNIIYYYLIVIIILFIIYLQ